MANSTRQAMPATRQAGAALVIALVFLLLMTILGVSSMQGTALQERMAGNQRDRNQAFQAAEAGLRAGEIYVDENLKALTELARAEGVGLTFGRFTDPAAWEASDDPDEEAVEPTFTIDKDDYGVASDVAVHVGQYIYSAPGPDLDNYEVIQHFPITARSVGGSGSTIVVLQSYCATPGDISIPLCGPL
ncbi:pilus assembly PilX family protein [Thiococcus pfennigii]|jgi:type IV pilus assembly protein PilX|uniref:pilus assembly PilX family protein n=1 Tax=Thiococcus pfennigii TaxID=1057 RepID=UPI001F5BC180|nr:PilX N-terminal domain-containing pilus assembly protein [Thiococcus pfennigii]MBK1701537.1 hypothetical protein [Thiococcus pfennigii]MBK1731988.1 hypothetical protein [Thiococcus pfennigii]